MHKVFHFQVAICLLLGACGSKPTNSPTPEEPTMTNTSTPPPILTPSPSEIPQTLTPVPSETLASAPPGYISRDYYSIQLPANLVDASNVNWRSEDYDTKLFYEIYIPPWLNTDKLPKEIWEKAGSDGSFDIFIVSPEYIKSPEVNGDLLAMIIIALGDPEVFTFRDYVTSFEYDPKILSEGDFITDSGVEGSGGILEHGDSNLRLRAGFLDFQTEGHSYYFLFTTSASSFEQIDDHVESALKSAVFYSGPEVPRPFLPEVPLGSTRITSFEPTSADLDPILQTGSAGDYVGAIYAGLVRLSPELEVVPDLAENWRISSDGTVYTFTLREGLAFQDGKRITAEDVRYSWERAVDPDWESPTARTYLGDITGVKDKLDGKADHISGLDVLDERTLQVTLDGPRPSFLFKLSYPTSFVVDQDTVEDPDVDWFQPNASGPYTIFSRDIKSLTLKRNEFYYAPAEIEYFEYSYYDNLPTNDWPSYFEAGNLDITVLFYPWYINSVLEPDHPVHKNLVIETDQCTNFIDLNPNLPPLDDIHVRQALALAIDRDRLNDELTDNLDLPAFTILPPGMPGYLELLANEQTEKAGYDPEAAVSELAASPYADSLPEIRMADFLDEDFANLLASMWEATLGVEVRIDESYYGELDDASFNEKYHLRLHRWCADYPDPENFLDILYSGDSDFNGFNIQDPLIHGQLEQARGELDNDRRITLYQDIERRLLGEFLTVPVMHSRTYFLVSSNIDGFLYPGIGVRYLDQLTLKK